MKIRFRYTRRYQIYVTLCACAASLALMVMRFGLTIDALLSFLYITLALLLCLFVTAFCFGWIMRAIQDKRNTNIFQEFESDDHD